MPKERKPDQKPVSNWN